MLPRNELRLGPIRVDVDDRADRGWRAHFAASAVSPGPSMEPHLELSLHGEPEGPVEGGYRARLLQKGLYAPGHVGPPAAVAWPTSRRCVLGGGDLDKLVWCYFARIALTLAAIERDSLHAKGTVIARRGRAVLFIGNGTTTAALAVMAADPEFTWISNTHSLIDAQGGLDGVSSKIRIRADTLRLVPVGVAPLDTGEMLADPEALFKPMRVNSRARLAAVVYREAGPDLPILIKEVRDAPALRPYLALYLCAMRRYFLEPELYEDVFERDARRFGAATRRQDAVLDALVATTPVLEVVGDIRAGNAETLVQRCRELTQ